MENVSSIVKNKTGQFYLMRHDDYRFNTENYKALDVVESIENGISKFNNRKCKIVTLKNDQKFEVFSDYSARLLVN